MKAKRLILNLYLKDIEHGGYNDHRVCGKYIGAKWVHRFTEVVAHMGLSIYSSTAAKRLLSEKELNPEECILLTESYGLQDWMEIASYGVTKTIAFNFESPLYLPYYFDCVAEKKLPQHSARFGYPLQNLYDPIFPAYSLGDLPSSISPEQRREDRACAILSNKNWMLSYDHNRAFIQKSPSFREAILHELHSERAQAIYARIKSDSIDLYGQAWEHPDLWCIKELYGRPIEAVNDKRFVLSRYKTALTYENVNMNGYVTEKSIDAILAGCEVETNGCARALINELQITQKTLEAQVDTHPFSHIHMINTMLRAVEALAQ